MIKRFRIRYGLGGGLSSTIDEFVHPYDSLEDAEDDAYESACEVYESYGHATGRRSIDEIMRDELVTEQEAEEIWIEDRERWLVYSATEVDE